jgi:thiol-disulfide isomerase/thioredoxin
LQLKSKRLLINIALLLIVISAVGYLYVKYRVAPDLTFSRLQLETADGQAVDMNQFKGKVVFLNFWKTWCGPCVQEMPSIEKAKEMTDSTKIVFIAVSDEENSKIAAFCNRHGYSFHIYKSKVAFEELGINTFPTTYILNKDGERVMDKIGGADWSDASMINYFKQLSE